MMQSVSRCDGTSVDETAESLRVLMYLFFPAGGIGRYTARLMPELAAVGASVEAAVVPEFVWRDAPGFDTWPGLRSISHPNRFRRKARFLIGQFVNPYRLASRAQHLSPDVIHLCSINHLSYPFWERAFPRTGPILAVTVHDVQRQKGILCKSWEAWQLKRFYRRADLLFVHSQIQVDELRQFAGVSRDKVCVIPHGPYEYPAASESRNETRRRLGIPTNAFLGLAFGQIRDEKRIDRLIAALRCRSDRIHLLVAGSTVSGHQPHEFYQAVVRRNRMEGRVHFLPGFIPDQQVGELFQASDWVALTYAKTFTSQSGVLSSAVNYRVPVLATPTPSFRTSLERFSIGVLCSDDSISGIRDGIERLQGHSAAAWDFETWLSKNSWRENARITVTEYARISEMSRK